MPVKWDELFEALVELCKIKDLKATAISSVTAGLITGAGTVLGGLLLGRFGLLLGATIGGGMAAAAANDFEPVWIILRDLPKEQKKNLLIKVINAFKNIGITDIAFIATLLLSDKSLQSIALTAVNDYFKNEMNLKFM